MKVLVFVFNKRVNRGMNSILIFRKQISWFLKSNRLMIHAIEPIYRWIPDFPLHQHSTQTEWRHMKNEGKQHARAGALLSSLDFYRIRYTHQSSTMFFQLSFAARHPRHWTCQLATQCMRQSHNVRVCVFSNFPTSNWKYAKCRHVRRQSSQSQQHISLSFRWNWLWNLF